MIINYKTNTDNEHDYTNATNNNERSSGSSSSRRRWRPRPQRVASEVAYDKERYTQTSWTRLRSQNVGLGSGAATSRRVRGRAR